MTRSRVLRNTTANIEVTFYQDGTPTSDGTVTVTITKADGTALATGAATTTPSAGVYRYGLAAQANLNLLKLVWTGATQTMTTYVEIVGAHLFTEAQARDFDNSTLSDATVYTDAKIAAARDRVTDLLESHTGVSWIPRFKRRRLRGSGSDVLSVPERHVSTLLSASVDSVALTSTELAAVTVDEEQGLFIRQSGGWWNPPTSNPRNIVVEYEHGYPYPVDGVDVIALKWARFMLVATDISDRTQSATDDAGTFIRFSPYAPSGLPEVDAWIRAHSLYAL